MTTTAPEDQRPQQPGSVRDLGRLRRTTSGSPYGRHVAGVAGGLARYFDVDPLVVRIAFGVAAIFGAGILAYAAVWLLVPEDGSDEAPINLDARTRTMLLWAAGIVAGATLLGIPFGGHDWFPWPVIAIAIVLIAISAKRKRERAWHEPAAGPSDLGEATRVFQPGRTPRPKRTGPIWFGWALATIAMTEGILALAAVSGAHFVPGIYPAAALAITGAYLVVGAFRGRAGGLILVGLVAAFATLVTTAADGIGPSKELDITPTSAAAVQAAYTVGTGSLTVDLTQVADQKALNGRALDLEATFGRIRLIVPPGTGVVLRAEVRGAGGVTTPEGDRGGPHFTYEHTFEAAAGHPTITVDAGVRLGVIEMRNER